MKRKSKDCDTDQNIPLPIQNFLWRQTSPFVRAKLGNLCEASCVSFERVFVQNILHGLSPSLCDSMESVSRWKLVQAAFPHVMHCCASMLAHRKQTDPDAKFTNSETKLLYTLQWIILDAASECEDQEMEKTGKRATLPLHSLSMVQLFVYLFAPVILSLKEDMFQSLKLESGLRLWQALWDFRQPDIPCFASPVRPKRNVLKANRSLLKLNTNAANIYIGKGSSTDNLFLCPEPIAITSRNSIVGSGIGSPLAPLARMSDICGTLSDAQSVSMFEVVCELCNATQIVRPGEPPPHCNCSKRASRMSADMSKIFPGIDTDFLKQRIESAVATATSTVGIPPNPDIMSASYFDVSVLRCLFSPSWVEDGIFWGLKYIHNRLLEMNDECLRTESTRERSKSLPVPEITVSKAQGTQSPKHDSEEEKEKKEEEQPATTTSAPTLPTPQSTLYISRSAHCIAPQQTKDYPSKRFRATVRQLFEGKRSLARIESVEGASDKDKDEKKSETKKEFGAFTLKVQGQEEGTPPQRATSALAVFNQGDSPDDESAADGDDEQDFEIRRKSMPSLRNQMPPPAPVMTQAVSGNIPTTVPKVATAPCLTVAVCVPPITTHAVSNEQLTTVSSTNEYIGSLPGPPSSAVSVASGATSGNSSAGTGADSDSNPSATTSPHTSQKDIPRALSIKPELCKPIITITEDSPSPSASEWSRKRESVASGKNENRPGMHRSLTDSNINYHWEDEIEEVTGSVHYIDARGRINLRVVLRAIHSVSMQDLTPRVCEVLLNITNVLLDMGVVSKQPDKAKAAEKKEENPNPNPDLKQPESEVKKDEEMPMHSMALDTVIRIFKSLGCPHGCGDGLRGSQGDHIRLQGTNCLQRLQRLHTSAFRRHLRNYVTTQPCQEVVDFLHAFLGFCNDAPPYSPAPHRKTGEDSKSKQTGFAINFGQSVNGSGPKGTEGEVIAHLLKPLVSRMMDMWKELHNHENISLYCDVRQLISYIKEQHGGTFRRVALSGLLDAIDRSKKAKRRTEVETPGNKGVRRTMSMTSDSGDEKECRSASIGNNMDECGTARNRRSLFKRKTKRNSKPNGGPQTSSGLGAASDSEMGPDDLGLRHIKLSPRMSMSATEDDPPSGPSTPKRKFSKFNIGWRHRASAKSDHDDESGTEGPAYDASSRRESVHNRGKKMSFKAAGQATLSFLTARKRLEDGFKSFGKKRNSSKRGSLDEEANRRGSHEIGSAHQAETVVFKEKKMVNAWNVKLGMARFGFFLDCCQPGSVPDPQLVAAMLDLEAPVVARAALLLECANFVHRCNKGEWPDWMKFNLPSFRGVHAMHRGGGGFKRGNVIQRLAGKMFHMWGEALGVRLEQIIEKETKDRYGFIQQVKDESKKKELREEDEEEDFMDEATVNQTGSDCPHALKMVACQLLLEITTFLRETYQYVPKVKTMKRELSHQNRDRKFSVVLSSPVHSDRSSASFTEQAGSPGERKISFAVLGERSDSIHSSTTTLSTAAAITGEETTAKGDLLRRGSKRKLLHTRRNSGHNASFKRTANLILASQRLSRFKRMGSLKNRKVSVQSITSDQKEEEKDTSPPQSLPQQSSVDVESPGVMSDEAPESPEPDDDNLGIHMPWIKVVIRLANLSNFICDHQNYCHPNCYERQQRGCTRLMNALDKVYYSVEPEKPDPNEKLKEERKEGFREKMKRRAKSTGLLADNVASTKNLSPSSLSSEPLSRTPSFIRIPSFKRSGSFRSKTPSHSPPRTPSLAPKSPSVVQESVFQPSSPIRRRESTPLLDKIKTDATTLARLKALAQQGDRKETKEEKKVEETPVMKYLKSQVQKLCHGPMAIMSKAAPVLSGEHFIDMLPVAWELLLENDQELSAAAASVLLLSAIKAPDQVKDMMTKELQHEDTNQRINAILRFSILWRLRYQVWPRMEEGAQGFFKVPPPSIDFVLPSPTIGLSTQPVVDASWTPYIKTKVEEMALNQEAQKSVVTATTTRRKQQQEMLHKALIAEEDRIRAARENFHVTNIAASQLAAHEPALHHSGEEHEEDAEEKIEHVHQPMQQAQAVFPSIICGAVLPIIHLLDDLEVNQDGISVSEVAEKVIWSCLVEDPPLFFRHFLEKLTNRDKQDELFFVLRRLILRMSELPAQTAHALFNYMVGYIMFYVRSPCEGSLNAIGGALSLLYLIVPHVNGISFKDLKQTLRKEQCDPTLLVTSNVPSAKKIIVHGTDLTSIPSQFPIHEDTQFSQILEDSIDFFNLNDDEKKCAFLVDTKSNQMHNLNSYVRDFYFFRRNFYPQLSMVMMDPDDAFKQLQRQAFTLKFVEIGKVLFSTTVLQSTPASQLQSHVNFLHEELTKLPSFPRKSLEAEFSLYKGSMGDEIYGMDMLHKFVWTKMLNTLFHSMNSNFSWMGDIPVFLSVINGTLLLHCDDISMLRFCLATYISISRHFKQVFATNGFMYIIPTMLRVYSNHQDNPIICQAIEFACKQFYILHRKPFILQMFGSIASIIDLDEHSDMIDLSKISPKCLYKLLSSMEQLSTDPLKILELVHGGGAMRALDFCYEMESESLTIIDAINVCVAVVAYASDSYRSQQMLVILDAIVPIYLKEVRKVTDRRSNASTARAEINNIAGVGVSMKALVNSCEALTRQISGPQRHIETVNTNMKPCTNHTSAVYYDDREDSVFKYMEEGNYRRYTAQDEDDEIRHEYRKPRDSLLNIAAEFYSTTLPRLRELRKLISDPNYKMPDLLDNKTHNRLADIALTLLKLAPYDTLIMSSRGLQRYMTEMLPITDWSVESVRPALNNILRRLDRLFNKIYKKPALRRNLNWDCAANLLKGLHLTLSKYRFIAHLPHLKTVINMCLNIILSDVASSSMNDSLHNVHHNRQELLLSHHLAAPPRFCSAVVKLMAMQMQCLGDQFSLEHICGGMSIFPTPEKTQNMLVNLILPLCIRVGSGRRDSPKIRQEDLSFALTVMLNAILPPSRSSNHKSHNLLVMGGDHMTRLGSISGSSPHERHNSKLVHDAILQTAFLGLKIMMVCFQKQLSGEWHRIAQCMKDLFVRQLGGVYLWKFLDFVVTVRPPIFIYLKPFIQFKVLKITCESEHEYYLQQLVAQRLKGNLLPPPRCSGTVLIELANELRTIKEEINTRSPSGDTIRSRTATLTNDAALQPEQNSQPNARPRRCRPSIADLMDPHYISRVLPLPNDRRNSKGGLGLLSTSPNVPPPPRTVVRQASLDKESISSLPESDRERERQSILRRQSTRRINASDGSKILEAIQGETEPAEEAEFMAEEQFAAEVVPVTHCLQRPRDVYYNKKRARFVKQQPVCEDEGGLGAETMEAMSDDDDGDPGSHRLQRADAKSRKTFKVKRSKTSIRKLPANRSVSSGFRELRDVREERLTPTEEESEPGLRQYIPKSKSEEGQFELQAMPHGSGGGTARARIARQGAQRSHASGVRSRSPSQSPILTRRPKSLPTSSSAPLQQTEPFTAVAIESEPFDQFVGEATYVSMPETYICRAESTDSISSCENAALLKEEEKNRSHNSLCIYFDGNDVQDTCV